MESRTAKLGCNLEHILDQYWRCESFLLVFAARANTCEAVLVWLVLLQSYRQPLVVCDILVSQLPSCAGSSMPANGHRCPSSLQHHLQILPVWPGPGVDRERERQAL